MTHSLPPSAATATPGLGAASVPLPVARIDGRWYLAAGHGHLSIDDRALTRDLETLATLLAPATSPGRHP
ncbi:hypothetical protein [Kitasatospora sp. NRRL B-11411]|uniref:hypothetical protein n=1 Tax=Kitasatospora sp. NRRL B-11411 TaxID=1463822 RepID=UPI0004C33FA5|nr:hypothetical protein [Kitasatospora sp. NRRL B-11411]